MSPDPIQAAGGVAVPLQLLLGVVAGAVATLAMDRVMPRVSEGETPPTVASGVLTGRHPDEAPRRLARAVHYLAGTLTGALFVWLLLISEALVGAGALAVGVAAAVLYALMVGFFALVVLPRVAGFPTQRTRTVRRAWAVDAAVYVLVLVPLAALATGAL